MSDVEGERVLYESIIAEAAERIAHRDAEIERLRAEIRTTCCPAGGWTGMPDEMWPATVDDCLKHGSCGCSLGAALPPHQVDPAA